MSNSAYPILDSALQVFDEPALVVKQNGDIISANTSFFDFFGFANSSLSALNEFWIGFEPSKLSTLSSLEDKNEVAIRPEQYSADFRLQRGDVFTVRLFVLALQRDLILIRVQPGRLKQYTLQGLHRQRMETLGMLAGGIAHDFNNILTGILGHVGYLQTILPKTGPHKPSLQAIEDGARKSALMTQQILNFSKSESISSLTKIDLAKLVESTSNLLRGAISKQYSMRCEVPNSQVLVSASESQITQVLVNLVVNARDALKPNGQISISLTMVSANSAEIQRLFKDQVSSDQMNYAKLAVADNGHGIPDDVLTRIFEPYFSTKKEKGTGLGLSTVNAIVKQFGGAIDVISKIGVGTVVSIYLPLASVELTKAKDESISLSKGEHILVVDDEESVRNVLSMSLERLGYNVKIAASGSEAIDIYSKFKVDLVILDMVMPELSGHEVFYRLKELNTDVRVLISTAYSSEEAISDILANGGKGYIQKPFAIEDLARKVRECLK